MNEEFQFSLLGYFYFHCRYFVQISRSTLALKLYEMRKIYFTAALCLSAFLSFAEADSVVTLETRDVFYKLDDKSEAFVERSTWDIAFSMMNRSVSVLINEGAGVELYLASANMNDWASFDTTGFAWTNLYNSRDDWEEGAFNANAAGHPDYGWGTYNMITHDVNAARFFVVKLSDGSFRKIKIDKMSRAGLYEFSYENLDGSSATSKSINKSSYSGKNFVYFNISTGNVVNEEPAAASWDLLFTKYMAPIQMGPSVSYYPVSGIKTKPGYSIARREGVETTSNDTSGLIWGNSITTIGYDWKSFNRTTFVYDIQDSLTFYLRKPSGEVWKLIFTDFKGSGQGAYFFEAELVTAGSPTANNELSSPALSMYPNPSKGSLNFNRPIDELMVFNTGGQMVFGAQNVGQNLDLSGLAPGSYVLRVHTEEGIEHKRLILE